MIKQLGFAIVIACMISSGNAFFQIGRCASPQLQQEFDAAQYTGLWYEQARSSDMPWESGDCQQARYSINADGSVAVLNSQYNAKRDRVDSASAVAYFEGPVGKVYFSKIRLFPGDYRVVTTDYSDFAIVYSCSSFLFFKTEYAWILTRDRTVNESDFQTYTELVKQQIPSYDISKLRKTSQDVQCKYRQ